MKVSNCLACGKGIIQTNKRGVGKSYCLDCSKQRIRESHKKTERKRLEMYRLEINQKRNECYKTVYTTPEAKSQRSVYTKELTKKSKKEIIQHYGGKCSCCGESQYEFLSIDHINGGGAKHRKQIGSNLSFYRWIIRNGYPDDLRVLCFNCNMARGFYGYCPHEAKPS